MEAYLAEGLPVLYASHWQILAVRYVKAGIATASVPLIVWDHA